MHRNYRILFLTGFFVAFSVFNLSSVDAQTTTTTTTTTAPAPVLRDLRLACFIDGIGKENQSVPTYPKVPFEFIPSSDTPAFFRSYIRIDLAAFKGGISARIGGDTMDEDPNPKAVIELSLDDTQLQKISEDGKPQARARAYRSATRVSALGKERATLVMTDDVAGMTTINCGLEYPKP